jgi:hypothetical protein
VWVDMLALHTWLRTVPLRPLRRPFTCGRLRAGTPPCVARPLQEQRCGSPALRRVVCMVGAGADIARTRAATRAKKPFTTMATQDAKELKGNGISVGPFHVEGISVGGQVHMHLPSLSPTG